MDRSGGCRSSNISVSVRLSVPPEQAVVALLRLRLSAAHGTRTVSDRDGLFELRAADWSGVERYRFGSRTADSVPCRRCGNNMLGRFARRSLGCARW